MIDSFTYERIDQLRELLGWHDRGCVTVTAMQGTRETTLPGDTFRSYEPSGDTAYVIAGPKDKIEGSYTVDKEDGTLTWTFKVRE